MTAYTPYQPVDDVHGPVRTKAKADAWRRQGLRVTEHVDRGGRTTYARVGWHANKTERHGLLRRKRTRVDLDQVHYELAKSAFGVVHDVSKADSKHLNRLSELALTGKSTTDASQRALDAGHSIAEINRATLAGHLRRARYGRVFKVPK